jgi:hypothetical protein
MDTAQEQLTVDQIKAHQYLSNAEHNLVNNSGTDTETGTTEENGKVTNDNNIKTTNDNTINGTQTNDTTSNTDIINNNNRSETYTRHQEGSSAGYLFTQNIEQWRKIMINIDMQIINELEELFMQIF